MKKCINILIGPILFAAVLLAVPTAGTVTFEIKCAIGTLVWMACWWVTLPVSYAVTGLLPVALNAIFQMTDMKSVISVYADETVMLLFGASMITAAWIVTRLDKRIATLFLKLIGSSLRAHLVFWLLLTVVLSAFLPNVVVVATVTPIAAAMLHFIGKTDIGKSKSGSLILLAIGWGTGLGGLATPLGGAMNLVVISYIEQATGTEFLFTTWVSRIFPFMALLTAITIVFLLLCSKKGARLEGSAEFLADMKAKAGRITRPEIICLITFCVGVLLSFTREFYKDLLPGLNPAYTFIACALAMFAIPGRGADKTPPIQWKDVCRHVEWGLLYMVAGGIALGTLLTGTGADAAISGWMSTMEVSSTFLLILVIVAVTVVGSDIINATSMAAVAIPIILMFTTALGRNPIPYIFIAAVGVNVSYCMPTSIRAVPVGYGLRPAFMMKRGALIEIIIILGASVLGYLLVQFWPAFSIA